MRILLILLLAVIVLQDIYAQDPERTDTIDLKSIIKRLELLEKKVLEKEREDELQNLLRDAEQLSNKERKREVDISKKFSSGIRQQQGLNPNISVLGDFFGSVSSVNSNVINEPGYMSHGSNGLYMRSLELSFVAPLDPYARGKAFLDITEEGVAIEELYLELINLPLNMSVKGGVFFPEFGLLNRHHTHALPQFDRPKAPVYYFGLDGFNGMGASVNFMLPSILFSNASSFDFAVINILDNNSYSSDRSMNPAYIGHFKNYYDLSDASYFEYTVSAIAGRNSDVFDTDTYIGSFGLHYKWEPPETAKYKSLDIKTEFYYGFNETLAGIVRTKGFYSLFHRKLNSRCWLGGRIGYSEMPDGAGNEWDYALNFDFWQSEFVFYRLQYQFSSRNGLYFPEFMDSVPSVHTVTLQVSWAMGPHKHEAY